MRILKSVIRSHKSKDRQYNGQEKKFIIDLQNTIKKPKDLATWTWLKTGGELILARLCWHFIVPVVASQNMQRVKPLVLFGQHIEGMV